MGMFTEHRWVTGGRMASRSVSIALASFTATLMLPASATAHRTNDVIETTRDFLDTYARGDERKALSFVTSGRPHIFGSDVSEATDSREGFVEMLHADHLLWKSPVKFGPMRHVSEERCDRLATVFFDADFVLGGHSIPVRFAMVWRRENGAWKLIQSSNVVPTIGQSASELLRRPSGGR